MNDKNKECVYCQHRMASEDTELVPEKTDGYKMNRVCVSCGETVKKDVSVCNVEGFVRAWFHDKLDKKRHIGKYKAPDDGRLIYVGSGKNVGDGVDVIAITLPDGRKIGNASRLNRAGSYRRGDEAPVQRVMFDMRIPMIPFNVFEESGLDLSTAQVIEQGDEEDFKLPKLFWNNDKAILEPVKIKKYCSDSEKDPKKLKNIKILGDVETEIDEQTIYDKNGNWVEDKDGNMKKKKVKLYSYEYLDLSLLVDRHFVGAMLLRVEGNTYLFDVDRNELEHYRMNPFLTQLPKDCNTIAEAYEMLKPKEVLDAESKGLDILRQGEWFFIKHSDGQPKLAEPDGDLKDAMYGEPDIETYNINTRYIRVGQPIEINKYKQSDRYLGLLPKYKKQALENVRDYNQACKTYDKHTAKIEEYRKDNLIYDRGGELQAGENRPNTVSKMVRSGGNNYCSGVVRHTGREHEDLKLEGWYLAVPNTAIASFTITGNID